MGGEQSKREHEQELERKKFENEENERQHKIQLRKLEEERLTRQLKDKAEEDERQKQHEIKMKELQAKSEKERQEYEKQLRAEQTALLEKQLTECKLELEKLNKMKNELNESLLNKEEEANNTSIEIKNLKKRPTIEIALKQDKEKLDHARKAFDEAHEDLNKFLGATGVSDSNCGAFLSLAHQLIPYNVNAAEKAFHFVAVLTSMKELLEKRFVDHIPIEDYLTGDSEKWQPFLKDLSIKYVDDLEFDEKDIADDIAPELIEGFKDFTDTKKKYHSKMIKKKLCDEPKKFHEETIANNRMILNQAAPTMSQFFQYLHEGMSVANELLALNYDPQVVQHAMIRLQEHGMPMQAIELGDDKLDESQNENEKKHETDEKNVEKFKELGEINKQNENLYQLSVCNIDVIDYMDKNKLFPNDENTNAVKALAINVESCCKKIITSRRDLRKGVLLVCNIIQYKPAQLDKDSQPLWDAIIKSSNNIMAQTLNIVETSANFFAFLFKFQSSFNVYIAANKNIPNVSFSVALRELKKDFGDFDKFQTQFFENIQDISKNVLGDLDNIMTSIVGTKEFDTKKKEEEKYNDEYMNKLKIYSESEAKFYETENENILKLIKLEKNLSSATLKINSWKLQDASYTEQINYLTSRRNKIEHQLLALTQK